ncbi:UvrB/uvrC motif protein [Pirellulimonas nuda]|uniref:UvrB/uvrC motif protein n=1 Tax=Pirellulimonas nuda TaxID=2528009 RepID=A0A518DAX5_9BACT|nr:UvrB/UvrC motif-containing protein [Pirellulimonas nuda]QDU88618.1 UvrB/uvrC motif protein [Pirellulimonas nuda]
MASKDLQPILADWPFDPSGLSVRAIQGEDGVPKIQLRIDLGVMQMNRDGRPDGQTFDGAESLLDFCRNRQREHDTANPDGAPYQLDSMACSELMREGAQFYHRYICFWRLGWYELCARDTRRNLRLFEFVQRHAAHERDKRQFDQWRPYVTMMHARAVATPLIELRQWDAALGAITAGVVSIEAFLDERGQQDQADEVSELVSLRRWRTEVEGLAGEEGPTVDAAAIDPAARLERRLEEAVAEERYEEASRLRDQLENLGGPHAPIDPHDADSQP